MEGHNPRLRAIFVECKNDSILFNKFFSRKIAGHPWGKMGKEGVIEEFLSRDSGIFVVDYDLGGPRNTRADKILDSIIKEVPKKAIEVYRFGDKTLIVFREDIESFVKEILDKEGIHISKREIKKNFERIVEKYWNLIEKRLREILPKEL